MHRRTGDPRILAIDLRSSRFGYVVMEGPRRLLDWGATSHPRGGATVAPIVKARISTLLSVFKPSLIVVKKVPRTKLRDNSSARSIVKAVRQQAFARSTPMRFVGVKEVRRAFRIFQGETKHEIAVVLTQIFPELLWKLPPKRKAWEPERSGMIVFDALAVGFAYWQRNCTSQAPSS